MVMTSGSAAEKPEQPLGQRHALVEPEQGGVLPVLDPHDHVAQLPADLLGQTVEGVGDHLLERGRLDLDHGSAAGAARERGQRPNSSTVCATST